MKWYNYLFSFLAGFFLANVVPHFVHGISGDPFPTPFANPPGKGLSSPLINSLWALFNLLVGYLFFRGGKITSSNKGGLMVFFVGIIVCTLMLSIAFADKAHV